MTTHIWGMHLSLPRQGRTHLFICSYFNWIWHVYCN